jgi:hypothetical protein
MASIRSTPSVSIAALAVRHVGLGYNSRRQTGLVEIQRPNINSGRRFFQRNTPIPAWIRRRPCADRERLTRAVNADTMRGFSMLAIWEPKLSAEAGRAVI